jgi:acyl-CoA synthetase (AMP-forming)/AMP-acid ligase II
MYAIYDHACGAPILCCRAGTSARRSPFARERLAAYKVPRSLDFEAELPRTPAGKLYVRRLRDRYWQGRERRI